MRLSRFLGWLLIGLVAWFFGNAIVRNWERVSAIDYSFTPAVGLVTALFAIAVLVSGWLWGKVFSEVTASRVPVLEAIRCHLASWVLKYIPGQVGGLIYKIRWADQHGAGKTMGALAYGYEFLFLTLSSTLIVIPLLVFTATPVYAEPLLLGYSAIVVVVLILAQRAPHELACRVIRRFDGSEPGERTRLGLGRILVFSAFFLIPRVINAVGFVVLAESLLPVEPGHYILLGAAYVLAGIIGIYAIFVPSGIGVREGVIVAFASMVFPVEQAIILSLAARLYATVADGLLGLGYLLLTRRLNHSNHMGTHWS